jgi:DNA-directed RNA polymerase I subunit RPA2
VIAVLSYTGYDIEDAMVINKASFERGFMHGEIYKTYTVEMGTEQSNKE